MDITPYKKPEYFRNRELSWISFDERVLNEARDKSIPLFERLKFISITSSNLDEFYMVRVASLKDQVHANYTKKDLSGMDAKEQLTEISKRTHELVQLQYNTYNRSAVPSLEHVGLTIISEHEKLTKEQAEYVDSYFEGTLDDYKKRTPELFTQKGTLRAEYKKADDIIKRIERDQFFMKCMSGEKQVIMTGELFGAKWKIKMDSYIKDTVIVDLKVMSSITKHEWVRDLGPVDFIRYWGYDIQGAVYQEIVRQNTGKKLPFYIAAATKEDETNIEVIHVADNFLRDALSIVEANMPRVLRVKNGEEQPHRCGLCDYCRRTKVLTGPIGILDLLKDV